MFVYLFWSILNDCHNQLRDECAIVIWCQWLPLHHGARAVQKSSHRSVFELGNIQISSSFIFHHIVFRDNGMMLLKSTVLLLLKDKIWIAHYSCNFCSVWKSWYWLQVQVDFMSLEVMHEVISKLILQFVEDSEHRNTPTVLRRTVDGNSKLWEP